MSTTRHLVNRRRRVAASTTAEAPAKRSEAPAKRADAPARTAAKRAEAPAKAPARPAVRTIRPRPRPTRPTPAAGRIPRAAAVLVAAAVLLGGFAGFAAVQTGSEGSGVDTGNTALTDGARTAEVKGTVTKAVNAVFSVNYADVHENEAAARKYLTGKAVGQHREMLAPVKADAGKQKLVLTTTVTDSGVQRLEGDRARLLIFADQRNTRTDKDETTYAAAMLSVDVVRTDGTWKIANIDTFTR